MPKLGTYNSPVDEKTIAKRLREARKRRGITQVELAEKLGIRQVLISQYELGQIRIHGAMIAGIATALGTSADDILGLKAPKNNGSAIDDRRFLRRLAQVDRLPKRKKDALLTTIDAFLAQAS